MKEVFFIAGALSDIAKQIVYLALNNEKYKIFALADLPSRSKELDSFIEKLKESSSFDTQFIKIELDVKNLKKAEDQIDTLFRDGYVIRYFAYVVGTNKIESSFSVSEETWDNIFDVNLKGFFFLSQIIGAYMMQGEGGAIVSVASQHGSAPNYDRAVYCASKAGMIHLSEALALDWAKYNIRVNTVSPTFMKTSHNEEQVETQAFSRKWLNSIPLHRCAEPSDVAYAALFLLSDKSRMITGHDLVVDGGWLLKHI